MYNVMGGEDCWCIHHRSGCCKCYQSTIGPRWYHFILVDICRVYYFGSSSVIIFLSFNDRIYCWTEINLVFVASSDNTLKIFPSKNRRRMISLQSCTSFIKTSLPLSGDNKTTCFLRSWMILILCLSLNVLVVPRLRLFGLYNMHHIAYKTLLDVVWFQHLSVQQRQVYHFHFVIEPCHIKKFNVLLGF